MTEPTLLWIFGALVAVIGGLVAAIWTHVSHCKDVAKEISALRTSVNAMLTEIGDHETGLRGRIHKLGQMVQAHEFKLHVRLPDDT